MQGLSTDGLLAAWERGRAEPQTTGRVLAVLSAAYPDVPEISLAELSIGERDGLLLALHEQVFGPRLEALAVCPGCGERLQLSFAAADVHTPTEQRSDRTLSVSAQQYEVEFRVPTSSDLLALSEQEDLTQRRNRLLERIVLRALCGDRTITASELPEAIVSAMETRMSETDPQAEVHLNVLCRSCGQQWKAAFDIGSFLWKEIEAWAIRVLREVHLLARAYGWREADILAMSAWRRYAYLEMLGA